jgi:cyclopropane-fatty-acyl-phospholipid synthase
MPSAPADRVVRLLRRVFERLDTPLAIRLWDGTVTRVGTPGETTFSLVFRSAPVLRRLLLHPTSLRFGAAYVDGEIDIEGDIFAAMRTANHIERMRVPLATRLAVLAGLLRI